MKLMRRRSLTSLLDFSKIGHTAECLCSRSPARPGTDSHEFENRRSNMGGPSQVALDLSFREIISIDFRTCFSSTRRPAKYLCKTLDIKV